MADRKSVDRDTLRLAAALVFVGYVLFVVFLLLHNTIDGKVGNGNNHVAEFQAIAAGSNWTAIHLGQFLATAIITAGLLALYDALNITAGGPLWLNRFGAVAAVVSLALAGVVYAVDGVALKQAADAWVQAPLAEKIARFASAEVIRWLEWGTRSYQGIASGLALMLFAAAIVWTARIPQLFGYLLGLAGITNIVLGWQTGAQGFAASSGIWFYLTGLLLLAVSVWLLVIAWRKPGMSSAASG